MWSIYGRAISVSASSLQAENNRGYLGVLLKMLCTPKANGFADQTIPFLNGYNWEYTLFSDKPIWYPPKRYQKNSMTSLDRGIDPMK